MPCPTYTRARRGRLSFDLETRAVGLPGMGLSARQDSETSAARTATLDTAHAASVMPRCASAFKGVATLVVQPDEQIVRLVAGGVAHSVLMMLKKKVSEVSPK